MISVVICSVNKGLAQQVQENIQSTIGLPWQAIVMDNTQSPKGITAVYNEGAAKAQFDLICFVHEDVLFQTQDWGKKLLTYFEADTSLGLVGVAGCKFKSKTPSGWYNNLPALDCCHITHVDHLNQQELLHFQPEPAAPTEQVVILDGVFLVCPKKVWAEVKFDDQLLTDFHVYDLDFSFRVAALYKVIVTFEIELLHITAGGNFANKWLESTLIWHKKMQKSLPGFVPGVPLQIKQYEAKIVKTWIIRLKHENISFRNQLHWLWSVEIWRHPLAWPFLPLFFLKKYLKKFNRS